MTYYNSLHLSFYCHGIYYKSCIQLLSGTKLWRFKGQPPPVHPLNVKLLCLRQYWHQVRHWGGRWLGGGCDCWTICKCKSLSLCSFAAGSFSSSLSDWPNLLHVIGLHFSRSWLFFKFLPHGCFTFFLPPASSLSSTFNTLPTLNLMRKLARFFCFNTWSGLTDALRVKLSSLYYTLVGECKINK